MAIKRKIIIGYQDTPQGRDALALGEVFAKILDAHSVAATVPLIATVLPWSKQLMGSSDLERCATSCASSIPRRERSPIAPQARR